MINNCCEAEVMLGVGLIQLIFGSKQYHKIQHVP